MAKFCIPPALATTFKQAVVSGKLDLDAMADMSSDKRRAALEPYVGADNVHEVNALFESKLLLKDQQRGLANWARKVAGDNKPVLNQLQARIQKMDRALNPESADRFLEDFVGEKLGSLVTPDEAKQIGEASEKVRLAQEKWDDARTMNGPGMGHNSGVIDRLGDGGEVYDMPERIAYGRALMDLTEVVESMKPGQGFWSWNTLNNLVSVPKTLMATMDMSAPGVQGLASLFTERGMRGVWQMFRYAADEENFKNLNAWIITHPDYHLLRKGKVGLSELGAKYTLREEQIQSALVEKATHYLSAKTGIPDLVRGSNRAFTGYLNYVRATRFYDLLAVARAAGEDVSPDSRVVTDIANHINSFTGRGNLGANDKYGFIAPLANIVFWAPRKLASTVAMTNPARYLNPRMSRTARIANTRQLASLLAYSAGVIGLAHAVGASMDMDPDSSDFLYIDIGGKKYNFMPERAWVRFIGRIIKMEYTRGANYFNDMPQVHKFGGETPLLTNFFRGKLEPIAGAFSDAWEGSDMGGNPFSVGAEMKKMAGPLTIHNWVDFAREDPENYAAMVPALMSVFGIPQQAPDQPPREMNGFNVWGQPADDAPSTMQSPVDKELKLIGYRMGFPQPAIQGALLNNTQYAEYIRISGERALRGIKNDMSLRRWASYPKEQKLRMIKADVNAARKSASHVIKMKYPELMHQITVLRKQQHGIAQ